MQLDSDVVFAMSTELTMNRMTEKYMSYSKSY